ncbi:hypothetical protein TW95_gp1025 [Pandoravirus inopinatum]|uniref:Uncharacterized protein n=1 Tax=Pandoravirus inopinatum TaxID=1605721 RepID=A0A0B5J2I1_9VIRU|nr:hypothetical protein TW95_gp1025 [Pandoravirus inopinatum]AJF97759.1 hypothetical protein [Pandoravirus inopinatum]
MAMATTPFAATATGCPEMVEPARPLATHPLSFLTSDHGLAVPPHLRPARIAAVRSAAACQRQDKMVTFCTTVDRFVLFVCVIVFLIPFLVVFLLRLFLDNPWGTFKKKKRKGRRRLGLWPQVEHFSFLFSFLGRRVCKSTDWASCRGQFLLEDNKKSTAMKLAKKPDAKEMGARAQKNGLAARGCRCTSPVARSQSDCQQRGRRRKKKFNAIDK